MNEYYYIKQGRRYVPAKPFSGFPADGVWIVANCGRENQLILKLGDAVDARETVKKALAKKQVKDIVVNELVSNGNITSIELADKISEKLLEN